MAIKTDTFSSTGGGGGGSDTLDDVTTRGATTTNSITVGGVSVGTEYSLPTADGSADQILKTDGNGTLSFTTVNVTGGLQYIGTFNATTGLPSLANAEKGDYYKISTEGTIYGQTWDINDSLLINEDMGGSVINSKIDKIDNTEPTNVLITTNNLSDLDNASTARTNLGLGTAATSASTDFLQVSNNLSDLNNASTARTNLGLGTAATVDTGTDIGDVVVLQDVGSVAKLPAVDGSQLLNISATDSTKLAIANNLSDLNNASTARTNLGVAIGSDVQAYNAQLTDIAGLATTDSGFIVGNGSTFVLESGATVRASLGLGTAAIEDHGTATGDLVILEDVSGVAGLPAVDGSQLLNITATSSDTLDDVTTRGATTTNAINVGTITTSGDILADADASRTIGAEATRFITYHGDMNGAIRFKAKNNQGSAITKGQVVYISGVSGTVPEVKLAQANSAATMPAFGLALANANDQAEVQVITFGNLTDYNTTTYSLSANDTVFVSATTAGALTNSAPTGESNLIQNIGRVVRADSSAGIIKVGGAGRSNATPNLNQDKIFVGDASNQAVSTALSTIGLSKFNNDSNFLTNINNESLNDLSDVSYTADPSINNYVLTYDHSTTSWGAEVVPSAPVTSVNTLTGPVVVSGDDILADHSASHYTATNNNIDGHFSGIDTKFGTLGTASTSSTTDFLSATGADTLGGNLDVGTSDIVSSSNNNIEFVANGTGVVKVKPTTSGGHLELDGDGTNVGKLRLMCEQSSHGIYLTGPSHSASASYTLKFPDDTGSADQVLKTDGNGNLDWVDQSGGGGGGSAPTVTSASPSSNYTISTHADNEEIYILNPSTDLSVFLPAASSCGSGYKYQIKNLGAYTLTIDPDSSEYIDHSGQTTFNIVQYESITLVTDGSNWFII